MSDYSPAWLHGEIQTIFPDIFLVTGTNITSHEGVELQHSRNMIIIRDGKNLSLINTVRLTDEGLAQLEQLGTVKNILSIGAFHGRDDAFYVDKYQAKLWTVAELIKNPPPIKNCSVIHFDTAKFPEAMLHINQDNGILITCDSIKNWTKADEFFSKKTAELYQQQGFFSTASIASVWLQATGVEQSDFNKLDNYKFQHLLSAHGQPLLNSARDLIKKSIENAFVTQQ